MKKDKHFTFQEDKNTIWFCVYLGFSKEWVIWAERNGKLIPQTKQFKKRLSKDWKEIFKIK